MPPPPTACVPLLPTVDLESAYAPNPGGGALLVLPHLESGLAGAGEPEGEIPVVGGGLGPQGKETSMGLGLPQLLRGGSQASLCPLSPEAMHEGPSVLAWASCPTLSLLEHHSVLILPSALWGTPGHLPYAAGTGLGALRGLWPRATLPFPLGPSVRTSAMGSSCPHAVSFSQVFAGTV